MSTPPTPPESPPAAGRSTIARQAGKAMTVSAGRNQTGEGCLLYVFIAYDDRPAYRRAVNTLVAVTRELRDDGLELRPLPWRIDILAEASWRALAVADATKAAIIVLSTSTVGALSEAFHEWLPACLQGRRAPARAVMALLGSDDAHGGPESPPYQFVRNAARRAGCDFLEPAPAAANLASLAV